MKKAVSYVRCSSELQKESIDKQLNNIKELCERHNILLVDQYEDISSSLDERPAFNQLMEDSIAGRFEYVFVDTFSRLSRSLEEYKSYKKALNENGVKLIVCDKVEDSI